MIFSHKFSYGIIKFHYDAMDQLEWMDGLHKKIYQSRNNRVHAFFYISK